MLTWPGAECALVGARSLRVCVRRKVGEAAAGRARRRRRLASVRVHTAQARIALHVLSMPPLASCSARLTSQRHALPFPTRPPVNGTAGTTTTTKYVPTLRSRLLRGGCSLGRPRGAPALHPDRSSAAVASPHRLHAPCVRPACASRNGRSEQRHKRQRATRAYTGVRGDERPHCCEWRSV